MDHETLTTYAGSWYLNAILAQLEEHRIRNAKVVGSILTDGSNETFL